MNLSETNRRVLDQNETENIISLKEQNQILLENPEKLAPTRENILAANGRVLDVLIAEIAIGWQNVHWRQDMENWFGMKPDGPDHPCWIPQYHKDPFEIPEAEMAMARHGKSSDMTAKYTANVVMLLQERGESPTIYNAMTAHPTIKGRAAVLAAMGILL